MLRICKVWKSLLETAFLTPSDVAFLLGVSVTTVYRCFLLVLLKLVRLRRKTMFVLKICLDKCFEEAGAPYKKKSYQT